MAPALVLPQWSACSLYDKCLNKYVNDKMTIHPKDDPMALMSTSMTGVSETTNSSRPTQGLVQSVT
ncbi:hypothetical protein BGX29_004160, partial [Mortierella sp. GBA35]